MHEVCRYLTANSASHGLHIEKKRVKSSPVRTMYLGIIKTKCLVYMNYGCAIKRLQQLTLYSCENILCK